MYPVRRHEPHAREIEMFDNFQFLQQHEPGGIGRRFENGVTAVIDRDRLLFLGDEFGEIALADQRTGSFKASRNPSREPAAVKGLGAVRGDLFERTRKFRLHNRRTQRRRSPIGKKQSGSGRIDQ